MIKTKSYENISESSEIELIGNVITNTESTNGTMDDLSTRSCGFFPEISDITYLAQNVINQVDNHSIVEQAEVIISSIKKHLEFFQSHGVDTSQLETIYATMVEEKSLFLEWTFNEFSLGFGIAADPKESSWYLVSSNQFNELFISDFFKDSSIDELTRWFILFALQNS